MSRPDYTGISIVDLRAHAPRSRSPRGRRRSGKPEFILGPAVTHVRDGQVAMPDLALLLYAKTALRRREIVIRKITEFFCG